MKLVKKKEKARVRQSQLGLFIDLIKHEGDYKGDVFEDAKTISEDFNVDCRPEDLEKYNAPVSQDWELESRKQENKV